MGNYGNYERKANFSEKEIQVEVQQAQFRIDFLLQIQKLVTKRKLNHRITIQSKKLSKVSVNTLKHKELT